MARCAGGGTSLGRGLIGEPQGLRNRPQVFCQRGSSGLRGGVSWEPMWRHRLCVISRLSHIAAPGPPAFLP